MNSRIAARCSAVLALLLLAVVVPAYPALASPWEPVVKVSVNDNTRSSEPAVALDAQGFAHVVWFGGIQPDNWLILYSNNRSGAFARPRVISRDRGEHREPDIAVGADGHVHVAYAMRAQGEIYYVESPNWGATWTRPRMISNSPRDADEPAITTDEVGNVYFAWLDSRNDEYRTFFASRIGGVYTPVISPSRATRDSSPDIAISGSGPGRVVQIVYAGRPLRSNSNVDYEVYLVSGTPAGFFPPHRLTNDGKASYTPALASNGGQQLFVAWDSLERAGHNILFMRSDNAGATWTPPANLTPRDTTATYPALAYGLNYGQPAVTIAWQEGVYARSRVLSLDYYPQTNTLGAITRLVSTTRGESSRAAVAGHPAINRTLTVYQGKDNRPNYRVYLAGRTRVLAATPVLNGGAALTTNPTIGVGLAGLSGEPTQMRYAIDRSPGAADPWLPLAAAFHLTIPAQPGLCRREVRLQVRNADGVIAAPQSAAIVVDSLAEASVWAGNPGQGDPAFTGQLQAKVAVTPSRGDCSGVSGTQPALGWNAARGRFVGQVPLAAGADGPRAVSITVLDRAGNRTPYTRQITLDTTPPTLQGGQLSAPSGPLPGVLADLQLTGLIASDNFYPGGFWGLQIANRLQGQAHATTDCTDSTDSGDRAGDGCAQNADPAATSWTTIPAQRGLDGSVIVRGWSVVAGLGRPLGDPALAGLPIQVQVRVVDGAGNPSSGLLTTTVQLAEGYRVVEARLPLVRR